MFVYIKYTCIYNFLNTFNGKILTGVPAYYIIKIQSRSSVCNIIYYRVLSESHLQGYTQFPIISLHGGQSRHDTQLKKKNPNHNFRKPFRMTQLHAKL